MAGPRIEIRSATPDELPQVISALVAAFITDPLLRFAWPSAHDYLNACPRVAGEFARQSTAQGTALVSADLSGAALWFPPGVQPDGEPFGRAWGDSVPLERRGDLGATFEAMSAPEEPHWALALIGVEPNAQGQGCGGALMRHAVARCDREGALAHLVSTNPRNISLYERHGFEVMGKIQIGAAPLVTPMLRRPR